MRIPVQRIVVLLAAFTTAAGPATAPTGERKQLTFTESNPVSDLHEWVRREGGTVDMLKRAGAVYDIQDESFEVYVPPECREGNRHGLLVWIPPGKSEIPAEWLEACDRLKLIWVCPNKAGNTRNALVRVSLAMDAVHNLRKLYPVDEGRVYVAGFSGGGRAASIAAVGFPDVFTGGLCMMGCNFYRLVPAEPGKSYPVGSFRPPGRLFDEVKAHPLVLVTSEEDMNRAQTKANFEAFKRDGFKHVTYLEVPGIGHNMPGAEWLEKGVAALDSTPVAAPATRPVVAARPAAVRPATTRGGGGGTPAVETRTDAERLLAKGRLYVDNGMADRAKEVLDRLVEQYPDSAAAGEAKKLLEQLKK